MCADALRDVGLYPNSPSPIRIDRFIEKKFGVSPTYEDLGPGILGLTRFGKSGVQEVIVSQRLDDENTRVSERRIRSTLAHEGGHGLLHEYLFLLDAQTPLFGESTPRGPKVLCRDEPDSAKQITYKGHWWEYQANRAIGSLLLPRSLVMQALEQFLEPVGSLGLTQLDISRRPHAIQHLVETFEVNSPVASIRLEELYSTGSTAQQLL
ncbi:MAG: ImmA/IrrE family metallo-endopeptidase [Gemmatimonadaceae bacterium]|nr:ImmA/IrrE family metallo-endopeptidase [Gemmatimonadaceae bacterium]